MLELRKKDGGFDRIWTHAETLSAYEEATYGRWWASAEQWDSIYELRGRDSARVLTTKIHKIRKMKNISRKARQARNVAYASRVREKISYIPATND
jgi:hypothetical protein